jgi:hypothetical protein
MELKDLIWLAVIFMTMNAGIAMLSLYTTPEGTTETFASTAFGSGGILSWSPIKLTNKDTNYIDSSTISLFDATSNSAGSVSTISLIINSIPGVAQIWGLALQLMGLVEAVFAIIILLTAGLIIFLTAIGAPPFLVFLFGVPTTIINIAGLFSFVYQIVSIARGTK